MDDVASVRSENANLRKIQQKLLQWERKENPLAPLTLQQSTVIDRLQEILDGDCAEAQNVPEPEARDAEEYAKQHHKTFHSKTLIDLDSIPNDGIDSTQAFLDWYNRVDLEIYDHSDDVYRQYRNQLTHRSQECDELLGQIEAALNSLGVLETEYNFVSNKTSSLNSASEKLISEQSQLNEIGDEIKKRLYYFTQVEQLSQRLQSPTISVSSEIFLQTLNKIDECLEYLQNNPKFKDASAYMIKYRQCLARAVLLMRNFVNGIFINATEQVTALKQAPKINDQTSDTAFAIYYGKFQASAARANRITTIIEERLERSAEYEQLLHELHQMYLLQRATIMSPEVESAIKDLTNSHKGDHCALVRSACAFIVHVCQDEHRLFYQFFTRSSEHLNAYLEGLCTILYDTLRPYIIHINHLETLAEICSILRTEMLDEHVQHNAESLEAFGNICLQLLQDVQERLVFRAHLYLQSDILNYKPSPGDLAYPDKLEMMESIAMSLQEQVLRRADSRASIVSMNSVISQDVDKTVDYHTGGRAGNSPADLHGMWYPTVRRTLVCLSRLYRCIDRPIFQSLSQEALSFCIQSVSSAAQLISTNKTTIDGELFEIKHLLILREQIAPFRVDFTVRETSLDFSKVKTAAYGLLQKRKQLFTMGSNNALLEFLLEGTPQLKEQLHDSRKDVDRQLKSVCELFIKDATKVLIGPVTNFIERAQTLLKSSQVAAATEAIQQPGTANPVTKVNYALRQAPWASPQQISSVIQESQRTIKSKLAGLQRAMQLYLSNKDTEFILFRPIRNNMICAFVKLEQILTTNGYSNDDLVIASCPTADQISVLLSNASIAADNLQQQQFQQQQTMSRKINTSSVEGDRPQRKISLEKKVSFDASGSEGASVAASATVADIKIDEKEEEIV